jgi:hypothetical protein
MPQSLHCCKAKDACEITVDDRLKRRALERWSPKMLRSIARHPATLGIGS